MSVYDRDSWWREWRQTALPVAVTLALLAMNEIAPEDPRDPRSSAARRGRALDVHRRGAAAEDDRLRVLGQQLRGRDRVRDDLAVDVRLADAAGDELRVLRAEVDDEDGVEVGGGVGIEVGHVAAHIL